MPDRLQDLYEFERELREAIAEGGPDSPNRAIWLQARRNVLAQMQLHRREYSAKQPLPLTLADRSAA
ncbi:hypothetical protein GCM10008959_25830 [Deinococcus seoulensis]|uniref:Uncharacterized protein n=1 Tax=Deinococcus seoulensis TaxID=1837379 RepID=A0ABQ2RT22_9DEIO|nr:hypothetical protein [Deinococcus seoulensis]GGR62632.1 hypothetical protein GCM10008959_25830 [Deinococcus seoulensis]